MGTGEWTGICHEKQCIKAKGGENSEKIYSSIFGVGDCCRNDRNDWEKAYI